MSGLVPSIVMAVLVFLRQDAEKAQFAVVGCIPHINAPGGENSIARFGELSSLKTSPRHGVSEGVYS